MIRKLLVVGVITFLLCAMFACSPTFEQPSITYNNFSLLELPGEYTKLSVNADITNMDRRDAEVTKVVYTATVEGVPSEEMTYEAPFTIAKGATVNMNMPVTFTTAGALEILKKLNNETLLTYSVTGVFTADTPIGLLDLVLDTSGEAEVDVDINDYFLQPTLTVNTVTYTSGSSPYAGFTLVSEIGVVINATIKNNDSRGATFKSAAYTVTLEGGLTSNAAVYSSGFPIAAGSEVTRSDLPAVFAVNAGNAAAFVTLSGKIGQQVNYTVNGTMTVSADLGAGAVDFVLPMAISGTTTLLD